MPKHNHILACVDGSKSGFHAFEEAIHMAKWMGASVTVITVTLFFEGDLSLVGVKHIGQTIAGPTEQILHTARRMALSCHARVQIVCEEGHPGKKILAVADSRDVDLIVIGAEKGMTWSSFFMESTLRHLIGHASQDILVIPSDTHFSGDDFLAVLGRRPASFHTIQKAKDLLTVFGGNHLAVLLPDGALAPDNATARDFATRPYQTKKDILRDANCHHAALMLLGRRDFMGHRRWTMGLRLEKLIRSAPCPVMVLPE